MPKSLFLFLSMLLFGTLHAQEAFRVPASFQAIGDASVNISSPLSVFSNPAGIAGQTHTSLGVQYEQRFQLKALRTASGFLVFPIHRSTFGLVVSQFGQGSWKENLFSIAVAKQLSSRFSLGITLHYFDLFLAENRDHLGTYAADLGIQYQMPNEFRAGFQLFNPYSNQAKTLNLTFRYPTTLRAGIQKLFEETLLLAFECRKVGGKPVEIRCGMDYKIREQLQLRMGIDSRTAILSLGVGYLLDGFQTDLTFSYHQYLGYSPSFSIYYQLP